MAEASEQYENKANGRNNLSSDQSSQTASAFSPLEYPRFYVASTGNKLAATLFAILLGVPSMVGLWYLCAGPAINDPTERFLSPACLGALLALCLWTALSAYRYKVVLRTDRIEYQALLARWSLSRDRIGNWRQCRIQGGKSLELTSTESNTVLNFTLLFKPDAMFDSWFADLPNADLSELKQSTVNSAPGLGSKKSQIFNSIVATTLLIYGTYGVVTNHFVLPARGGESLVLYGYPAWIMYAAFMCAAVNFYSNVFRCYDKHLSQLAYKKLKKASTIAGWLLFLLACVLSFVKHTQDYVCRNIEVRRVDSPTADQSALVFDRYCALLSPTSQADPTHLITVVRKGAALSEDANYASYIFLNKADLGKLVWTDNQLMVVYRFRENLKSGERTPKIHLDVPVLLVNEADIHHGQLFKPNK